jgi:hypothetical protein|tara:strand:- start:98 stop:268 length:171 start_codon:yes stop_codon:yes gene_type:complete
MKRTVFVRHDRFSALREKMLSTEPSISIYIDIDLKRTLQADKVPNLIGPEQKHWQI